MTSVGIITIHKIFNYGSVLQAYALQEQCKKIGYRVEIIDYLFPNEFQRRIGTKSAKIKYTRLDKIIKYLYAVKLLRQHRSISNFVKNYQQLSVDNYSSPEELKQNPPLYDIYITGSDQLWNPNYCCGDPSFFLDFVPEKKKRISYAASFGISSIDEKYRKTYSDHLLKYSSIGVRENSAKQIVQNLVGEDRANVVLDPTLLLNKDDWSKIANPKRLVKGKYILCYYLNYSFDAFPYADDLAKHLSDITGYELVKVARPPHHLFEKNTKHPVDASPKDFLAYMRDAELVLTTSFHGTAFAINFEKPLFSIVANKSSSDSRQMSILQNVGLESRALELGDEFPSIEELKCNYNRASVLLQNLREQSINFLKKAIADEL